MEVVCGFDFVLVLHFLGDVFFEVAKRGGVCGVCKLVCDMCRIVVRDAIHHLVQREIVDSLFSSALRSSYPSTSRTAFFLSNGMTHVLHGVNKMSLRCAR